MTRYMDHFGLNNRALATVVLIIAGSMSGLGYWVNAYIRADSVQSAADTNAFYMNAIFEPLLHGVDRRGPVPPEVEKKLDAVLAESFHGRSIATAVIWWRDGTVAYSTDKAIMGRVIQSPQLARAFAGEIVAEYSDDLSDHGLDRQKTYGEALLEIYTPLRDPRSNAITAAGEFYQNAAHLRAELHRVAFTTWGIVGATTLLILILLLLIMGRAKAVVAAQREELRHRLADMASLAAQNERLGMQAEAARLDAFSINETLLHQIGQDLHDGPLQLLSLIVLRLQGLDSRPDGGASGGQRKTMDLAIETIRELRNIAYGLVLPELEDLTVEHALLLAISRHERQTDTVVKFVAHDLPERLPSALKICLYRTVQEALNNAFRHADGIGQQVIVSARPGDIEIVVRDGGPGLGQDPAKGRTTGLGLAGMAKRLQTFGGTLTVDSAAGQGTTVTARLPVPPAAPAADGE